MAQQQEILWFRIDAPRRSDALSEPEPRLGSSAASCAAASGWQSTGAQRPAISDEARKCTSRLIPTSLCHWVSAATQTEETEPSAVESSVDVGTAACSVADDMQTEGSIPCDVHVPSDQDAFHSAATDAEAWLAPPSRRKRHNQNDALLNAAITSVAEERSELANTFARQVDQLQQDVCRVGLVCPRHPWRHRAVAPSQTPLIRCLRCNTLPARGEAWVGSMRPPLLLAVRVQLCWWRRPWSCSSLLRWRVGCTLCS